MAKIEDVLASNPKAFEGSNVKEQYDGIASKLTELGYDVLINHREKAEFIPSARLSEVAKQRDDFKGQIETLNSQLEELKKAAGSDSELKKQLGALQEQNSQLLANMDGVQMNAELLLAAKDAINPQDVLVFVNKEKIKKDAKGNFIGINEEIERIKKEKPYLFSKGKSKGGIDNGGDEDPIKAGGMNALIRMRAGRA